MMLQFYCSITESLTILTQSLYLQGFIDIKKYLRKPCSFDFVTLTLKLIPDLYQF